MSAKRWKIVGWILYFAFMIVAWNLPTWQYVTLLLIFGINEITECCRVHALRDEREIERLK